LESKVDTHTMKIGLGIGGRRVKVYAMKEVRASVCSVSDLRCHVKATRDFAYREKDRIPRAQRRAGQIQRIDVLYRVCCVKGLRCDKTGIRARKVKYLREKEKRD